MEAEELEELDLSLDRGRVLAYTVCGGWGWAMGLKAEAWCGPGLLKLGTESSSGLRRPLRLLGSGGSPDNPAFIILRLLEPRTGSSV